MNLITLRKPKTSKINPLSTKHQVDRRVNSITWIVYKIFIWANFIAF